MSICNPCACWENQVIQTPKPCPKPTVSDCCVGACNGLIKCDNGAVGPCGQKGTLDLKTLKQNTSGCDGAPVYRLVEYDTKIFTSVTIKTDGTLEWVTGGADTVGKYGDICYKIICMSKESCGSCVELKSQGTITIGVKDLCAANACEECETCNKCTGECVKNDVKLGVKDSETKTNLITK